MKNKLFIIVACFSLMALCGTAWAGIGDLADQTGDRIETVEIIEKPDTESRADLNTTGFNVFKKETLLKGQRLELCGNGTIDEGEQCEFKDGVMIRSEGVRVLAFPSCDTDNGEVCDQDTCLCKTVPICGDGNVAHGSGEQCESFDKEGNALDLDKQTMLCQRSKTAGMDVPDSTAYTCVDCMCQLCGNGIVDPGEDCDGTAGCNSECKMAPEPTTEPEIKCVQKETGALASDYINELNAQGRAIMSEAKGELVDVDLFVEAVHSEVLTQIEFPNSVVKGEIDEALKGSVAKSGDSYVTGIAFVQESGAVYNDMSKMVEMTRESLQQPVLLFPRASGGTVSKGKSLIGETEVIVPDVKGSFGGAEVVSDLAAAGLKDTEVVVVDANQEAINHVMRFMVVPHTTTALSKAPGQPAQLGSKTAILQARAWFAPGAWGDSEGGLIQHNPNEVLSALQEVATQLKSEGRQDEIGCGIVDKVLQHMKDKGQDYEPQMVSKFAALSGALKVNSATGAVEEGDLMDQRFGHFVVPTEMGAGGAGSGPMSCSISAAQTNAPQIMIALSMLAVAITGVGIVRRRRR